MSNFVIKQADNDVQKELQTINFDSSYIESAKEKYRGAAYKIFDLKPYEANIIKQICLSLGFDCALSRDSVTCKCEKTDCLIFGTQKQYKKLVQRLQVQPFRLKEAALSLDRIITKKLSSLTLRDSLFDWNRAYIMGILNVTPDSFSDGGRYNNSEKAFVHCIKLIEEGADIIDIGGESTRPGAKEVTVEEEIKRVIPVIKKIREKNIQIPISVDTRNYETAERAIDAGADIINDITGLDYDKKLFKYITKNNIPVVITHSDTVPAVSKNFTTGDIVEEVYKSLQNKIELLNKSGLQEQNIIADVGIGFGKSTEGNYELLQRAGELTTLKVPLLVGISRKSFIRNTFELTAEGADIPTALYSAMLKEINIHRVHNVAMTKQFLNYAEKIKSGESG